MDQETKKVRWGIVSTGRITHQFASDFEFVPNGEILAVASRSQASADKFAMQYGRPRAYSSYGALLENPFTVGAGGCLLEMGIYPVAIAWLFLQQDPDDIQVIARKAPNGVEDDVQMLFNYGDNDSGFSATLATSFRSKLQNWAYIIGEEGYIVTPDKRPTH